MGYKRTVSIEKRRFLGLQRNSRNSMPNLTISGPGTADAPETATFHCKSAFSWPTTPVSIEKRLFFGQQHDSGNSAPSWTIFSLRKADGLKTACLHYKPTLPWSTAQQQKFRLNFVILGPGRPDRWAGKGPFPLNNDAFLVDSTIAEIQCQISQLRTPNKRMDQND